MTQTRKRTKYSAVAVFDTPHVKGHVVAKPSRSGKGIDLLTILTHLPIGKHGFHIHKAGDLREKNCLGLCEHYDKGRNRHGAGPTSKRPRHTGDLGNVSLSSHKKIFRKKYYLENVSIRELWGRSIIIHKDEDDLGKGNYEDSSITGHSGSRMACAIFGRGCHLLD